MCIVQSRPIRLTTTFSLGNFFLRRIVAIFRKLPGARERAMEPEFAPDPGREILEVVRPGGGHAVPRLRRPRGQALASRRAGRSGRRGPPVPRTAGIDPGKEPLAAVLTDDETTEIIRADPEPAPTPFAGHFDPNLLVGIRPDRSRMARSRGLAVWRGDFLPILGIGHRGQGPGFERGDGVRGPGIIGHF